MRQPVRSGAGPWPGVVAIAFAVCSVAACGSNGSSPGATTATMPPTTTARHTATGRLTTADGSYQVTLTVRGRPSPRNPAECPPADAPGATPLRVGLMVVNEAGGRTVPFPPLRVELVAGGAPPAPVPVRAPGGPCNFTPTMDGIAAGATVSFSGATPPVADNAAPGSAGAVQVAASESLFTLSVAAP